MKLDIVFLTDRAKLRRPELLSLKTKWINWMRRRKGRL